jgi:RNA polymerase sigma-70 factor, ECF subfamily
MPSNGSSTASTEPSPRRPDFREVFDRELDFVWNCLKRLGVPSRDVEDVAHEVFVRVEAALHEYDPDRPLRAWLFGFIFRLTSEYRRRPEHRLERVGLDPDSLSCSSTPEDEVALRDDQRLLLAALGRVDLERRAILLLHDAQGIAIPEVARSLGIPLNTAYSRLRLGRADLRAAIERMNSSKASNR